MKKYIACIAILLHTLPMVFPNASLYTPGAGGMLYPMKNKSFVMTEEKIDIDVYPVQIKQYMDNTYFIQYDCLYIFKNDADAQTYLLGFPVSYGTQEDPFGNICFIDPFFADFRVYQDNRQISYRKYIHGFNPELKNISYDEVYGFSVPMEKNGRTEIRALYSIIITDHMQNYGRGLNYILKSGRNFPKPVHKADINIRFHYAIDASSRNDPDETTYPDARKTIDSDTTPFRTYSWHFTNFVPSDDITAMILQPDRKYYSNASKAPEFIKKAKTEKTLGAYFQLLNFYITNREVLAGEIRSDISAVFRDKNRLLLEDDKVSPVLKGLIVSIVSKNEEFSPGKATIQKAVESIKKTIADSMIIETENLDAVFKFYKKDPLDTENIKLMAKYMDIRKHQSFYPHLANDNYYIREMENALKGTAYQGIYTEIKTLLQDSITATLSRFLADSKTETTAINEFIDLVHPADIDAFIKQNIEKLTDELWKTRSNRDSDALILSRLLPLVLTRSFYHEADILEKLFYERLWMRKGYYTLANYYCHFDYQKSDFYYRIAFSFCETSPLWDYLEFGEGLMGQMLDWSDNSIVNTDTWKSGFKPWWKSAANKENIREEEIADMFTPEKILTLDLARWKQENYHMAPCYFIAYNAACLHSKAGKYAVALRWLEIAYRLNKKEVLNFAWTDEDMENLRKKESARFKEILSK